jgi:hypothetical protein
LTGLLAANAAPTWSANATATSRCFLGEPRVNVLLLHIALDTGYR